MYSHKIFFLNFKFFFCKKRLDDFTIRIVRLLCTHPASPTPMTIKLYIYILYFMTSPMRELGIIITLWIAENALKHLLCFFMPSGWV